MTMGRLWRRALRQLIRKGSQVGSRPALWPQSGQLSIWLQRGMVQLGLPAICIDARKAHKSLSARLNKSDSADAEGLAQLARMNWFTPVHICSEETDPLRALTDYQWTREANA